MTARMKRSRQPDRAISGSYVTRVLDRAKAERGLPKVIRSDNGSEFCGRAMLTWAHENGVLLRFIEPGKPNQNAYVESFNGQLRASEKLCGAGDPINDRRP